MSRDIDFSAIDPSAPPLSVADSAWLAIATEFRLSIQKFGQSAQCQIADDGRLEIFGLSITETALVKKNINTVRRVVKRDSLAITGIRFLS